MYRRTDGDGGAGAFVRGGAGKGGAHSAFGDHEVGVAEGGDGDFYEDLVWGEGGGGGDGVDFVGSVELRCS